jgi:hypothetical protein
MTQEPRSNAAPPQALEYTEYMVNTLAESAKQYWRWWGPLGEPMIRTTEQWAEAQRKYLNSLRKSQGTGGESEQRAKPMASFLLEFPLRGLTFDVWPGPGDSEGGGWDR